MLLTKTYWNNFLSEAPRPVVEDTGQDIEVAFGIGMAPCLAGSIDCVHMYWARANFDPPNNLHSSSDSPASMRS